MIKNFIGVDFSKNSTGITLIKPDKIHFFSIARDYEGNSHKKAFQYHNILSEEISDCSVFDYSLLVTNDKKQPYYVNEWNKLKNGRSIKNIVFEALETFMSDEEWEETVVAFEGYAYGAKGNVLIDLVTMTSILKHFFEMRTKKEVYVFAPTAIKSSATGSGRSKKDIMFEFFLKEKITSGSEFQEFCRNQIELVKKKNSIDVPKPFDDIIDSYFVVKHLIKYLSSLE